jgi:hypothetical protein
MIAIMLALLAVQPTGREVDIAWPEVRAAEPLAPIEDRFLLDFVRQDFDPMSDRTRWPRTLGMHHGVPVIVSYTCSDLCPDYTKRIVRYNLLPGEECAQAGGISKDIVVPRGIGTGLRRYCIPAVTEPYQQ